MIDLFIFCIFFCSRINNICCFCISVYIQMIAIYYLLFLYSFLHFCIIFGIQTINILASIIIYIFLYLFLYSFDQNLLFLYFFLESNDPYVLFLSLFLYMNVISIFLSAYQRSFFVVSISFLHKNYRY